MTEKTCLCVECRATFTDEEIKNAERCPSCQSEGVPADPRQTHTLTLTDHEWRILFMWAENWAQHIKDITDGSAKAMAGIRSAVMQQDPTMPPLTLFDDVQELATSMGSAAEIIDPDGNRMIVTPKTIH